jgi:hypothetical protein
MRSSLQPRLPKAARRLHTARSGDRTMFAATFKFTPAVVLLLAFHVSSTFAQTAPSITERLHAEGVASFREARFPAAYARFIRLADAGHAPSAELALWMYQHGPSLFGRDWDTTQDQLTAWAHLAQQPVPTLVPRVYPPTVVPIASRQR